MVDFIRLISGASAPRPDVRVLKADDYRVFLDAKQLIENAQHQADKLLAEAGREFERQKQRGYEAGLEEAKMESAERMIEMVGLTVDYLSRIENEVADVVMIVLRRVLGEFEDAELVPRIARQALDKARNQQQVRLRVNPSHEAALRARFSELLAGHRDILNLEILADFGMGPTDCVLETEIGIIDASLDSQLQALEKALHK